MLCVTKWKFAQVGIIMLKKRNLGIAFVVSIILAAIAVNPVLADSCTIRAGYSVARQLNYDLNTYIGVILPVLVRCSSTSGQLYVVGTAHDITANADLPSASTQVVSGNGISAYTGQLVFNVLPDAVGHILQVSITLYSGQLSQQSGTAVVSTGEIVPVDPTTNYVNVGGCSLNGACNTMYNYCQSPGSNSLLYNGTVQCVGYIYQDANGCVELVIPVYSPYGLLTYQYYSLQNLPAKFPPMGTWVAVTGQLQQGSNSSPNGFACPGNYISLTSIA